MSQSSVFISSYGLVKKYKRECNILSHAYKNSEKYFRWLHKALSYPLIITAAVGSVIGGMDVAPTYNNYIMTALSLVTLILAGFTQTINPIDKANSANQISNEFSEIAANIQQFISENHKSPREITEYSQRILTQLEIWRSLCPPIQDRFIKAAQLANAPRAAKKTRNFHTNEPHYRTVRTVDDRVSSPSSLQPPPRLSIIKPTTPPPHMRLIRSVTPPDTTMSTLNINPELQASREQCDQKKE